MSSMKIDYTIFLTRIIITMKLICGERDINPAHVLLKHRCLLQNTLKGRVNCWMQMAHCPLLLLPQQ